MAENNKTRFFYVLYSDKTRVFDQSERAYYPIYIINLHMGQNNNHEACLKWALICFQTTTNPGLQTVTKIDIVDFDLLPQINSATSI